jgi:hypothetical protein
MAAQEIDTGGHALELTSQQAGVSSSQALITVITSAVCLLGSQRSDLPLTSSLQYSLEGRSVWRF